MTYILGIARNVWLDAQKRRSRRTWLFTEELLRRLRTGTEDPSKAQSAAQRAELVETTKRALEKLPDKQKEAIRLVVCERGIPLRDAAMQANCSVEAYRSRLRRARNRLRQLLKPREL